MAENDQAIPATATLEHLTLRAKLKTPNGVEIDVNPSSQLPANREENHHFLLVGRQAATADVRIVHGSISRKHAAIYFDGDSVIVKDFGGKHGTTVNDDLVKPGDAIGLTDGDTIRFGNSDESFRIQVTGKIESDQPLTTPAIHPSDVKEPSKSGTIEKLENAGAGLSGRAKREAEIAAMMSSLDETPAYLTVVAPGPASQEPVKDVVGNEEEQKTLSKKARKLRLPITEKIVIESESNRRHAVTVIAIDPSGSRFAIGSSDTFLRLYDFSGMNQGRQSAFRSVIPEEGHWPVSVSFSNTGDRMLVGTTSVQPVVLDREGQEELQFVRGDMYVTDQTKTSGHTAGVSAVEWHPLERDRVLTASADGSARIWYLSGRTQFQKLVCEKVFSIKDSRGRRTAVTSLCFHPAGREFAVGTVCGSVQIWSVSRLSGRPERAIFDAHGSSNAVTSLCFNIDGTKLASRSNKSDQVKVWDQKRLSRNSSLIALCNHAFTIHEHANVAFDPEGRLLCVPVSERWSDRTEDEKGRLNFYILDEETIASDPVLIFGFESGSSPISIRWHQKLNQIFAGCSDGKTLVLFDRKLSNKGAIISASRGGQTVDSLSALLNSRAPTGSAGISGEIVNPFALPIYRDEKTSESKRRRLERKDPVKSKEPERPATGKHKMGGQTGGSSFAMFVADQNVDKTKPIAGRDPREALFQYTEGKSYIDGAYAGNKMELAKTTVEEEFSPDKQERDK